MDDDEIDLCQGLENKLEEINFDNNNIEKVDEVEEELVDINTQENKKDISELMREIDELKRIASQKDDEVKSLKNKYKSMYSELNL